MQSSLDDPKGGIWTVDGSSAGAATATLNDMSSTGGLFNYTAPLPTSETFTATLDTLSGDGIQSVSSTVSVQDAPAVPGPLPIFGAAAAFGFSRKVRNRIKAAA